MADHVVLGEGGRRLDSQETHVSGVKRESPVGGGGEQLTDEWLACSV